MKTKTTDLVRGLLGRMAFTVPAGRPEACCVKSLESWRGRRAVGARRECLECGQILKAVLLDAHSAGRDDILPRGPGPAAVAKEAEPGYRVVGAFVSKTGLSPEAVPAALSTAGRSDASPEETEFGWWAGLAPDGAYLVEAERGVWVVLERTEGG